MVPETGSRLASGQDEFRRSSSAGSRTDGPTLVQRGLAVFLAGGIRLSAPTRCAVRASEGLLGWC
jgi:hypothetical protein